jgi:hypothetical protein
MKVGCGDEEFNGLGYVCYIDILGFSRDIFENWNNNENDPLKRILDIYCIRHENTIRQPV